MLSLQQPLVRGSGCIILANDLAGNLLFAAEFENGLKEVEIQASLFVNTLQQGILLVAFEPVIADDVTNDQLILALAPPARASVFDMGLTVLLVKMGTGKGDVLVQAIAIQ
jgi:hypothetical protein